jgi:hypothetical protein
VQSSNPTTKVVILGPQLTTLNNPANFVAMQTTAATYSNVIACINTANWTAQGGVVSTSDGSHPSPVGIQYIAAQMEYEIRKAARANSIAGY